jgi:hypothetical protein
LRLRPPGFDPRRTCWRRNSKVASVAYAAHYIVRCAALRWYANERQLNLALDEASPRKPVTGSSQRDG